MALYYRSSVMTEPILLKDSASCTNCGTTVRMVTFLYPNYARLVSLCPACDVLTMKELTEIKGAST